MALHESNRVPGLAIRVLGRFARRVYLPPGIKLPSLHGAVARPGGMPVRKEIQLEIGLQARRVTVSIGIAPFGAGDGLTAVELLNEADIAMYDAKEAGRDRFELFDADVHLAAESTAGLGVELVQAPPRRRPRRA